MSAVTEMLALRTAAPEVIDLRDGHRPKSLPVETASPIKPSRPVQPSSTPRLGYLPALDGLRAIAVLAVLLYHADVSWAPGGFLGVDVFFVLSGFLITTGLLESAARSGRADLGRFYLRRARRLIPALVAVLIGSTVLVIAVAPDAAGSQQRDLPAALTYLTNWVYVLTDQSYFQAIGRPPMLEHLWSLAIEEQFYLIWPWVFLLAWRMGGTARVRRFAGIGALASTTLMMLFAVRHGLPTQADPSRVYFGTDTHAMGLLTGAVLATLWVPRLLRTDLQPGARRTIDGVACAALAGLMLVFWRTSYDSPFLYRGGFLLLSALVAMLLVAVTHPASRIARGLGSAPMRYLGTRSYGIYLWHWPIFLVTRPGLDVPLTGFANFALRMGLTVGVAELSYRFLETPVRRLGFRGAWQSLLERMAAGPLFFPALSRKPMALAVIPAVLLLGMTVRLYALPAQADYLGGVTSMSAIDSSEATDPVEPLAVQPPSVAPRAIAPAGPQLQVGQLGLGESVMIGASGALARTFPGIVIDAAIGRADADTQARAAELAAAGALRQDVILHTGTNGAITSDGLRATLDAIERAGAVAVAVVNDSVPRRWQDPNNAIMVSVVQDYENAVLIDWHAAVLADPSLVNGDGVHPSVPGAQEYADLIDRGLSDLHANQPS